MKVKPKSDSNIVRLDTLNAGDLFRKPGNKEICIVGGIIYQGIRPYTNLENGSQGFMSGNWEVVPVWVKAEEVEYEAYQQANKD